MNKFSFVSICANAGLVRNVIIKIADFDAFTGDLKIYSQITNIPKAIHARRYKIARSKYANI